MKQETGDNSPEQQLRSVEIERNYTKYAEGSVLISTGDTRVICTASVEDGVPYFLRGEERGWMTAEYSLLPRSTHDRTTREAARGKVSGRTREIQRLIGRALRAVFDLTAIGERTIWVDCDVIQADGGTRTASITGGFVALCDAVEYMKQEEIVDESPISEFLAATSVGIVDDEIVLDLCYEEDSAADVDMNVVMTESGDFVEIQGTAEESPFSRDHLDRMLKLSEKGIMDIIEAQKTALGLEK